MLVVTFLIFIILSAYHFYYQNVVIPILYLKQDEKLRAVEIELDSMKTKNTISPLLFLNFKLALTAGYQVIKPENTVKYMIMGRYTRDSDSQKTIEQKGTGIINQLKGTSNSGVKELYNDYYQSLIKSFMLPAYSLLLYTFPFSLFKLFTKRLSPINTSVKTFVAQITDIGNLERYLNSHV